MPRHLLFHILHKCGGEINREKLYEHIYNAGQKLSKKDYRIQINIKGCNSDGYWSDDVDSELCHYIGFGIIKNEVLSSMPPDADYIRLYPEKNQTYIFVPKEKKPFDCLENILKLLDSGLESEVLNDLEEAVAKCKGN